MDDYEVSVLSWYPQIIHLFYSMYRCTFQKKTSSNWGPPIFGHLHIMGIQWEQGCIMIYIYIYAHAIHDGNVMGLSENLGHLKMIKNCFCIDQP